MFQASFPAGLAPAPSPAAATISAAALLAAGQVLLPNLVRGAAVDARSLREAMTAATDGSDAEGAWSWKDAYEACEVAQLLFLRRFGAALRAKPVAAQLAAIGKVAALLPTHTRRSEESHALQQYLLKTADLDYWRDTNLPVIIVVLRLSDQSLYWKDVSAGVPGDERRLKFDKSADRLDSASIDRMAQLSVERGKLGSFVPPMRSGEPAHLNLMRIILPDEIFVAESPFKSGRDAMPTLLSQDDRHFDWVVRGRRFVSFRDPTGTAVEKIIHRETLEAVETEYVALTDDSDDEIIMIELLRRTMDEQFAADLAYDRDTRAFHFRPPDPLVPREYRYRSLKEMTSATVVQLYPDRKKPDRLNNVRHHAFAPRFERIGDDWFVSITPTFFFSENGSRPHRFASTMLAGKKRLDRNGSVRGQVMLWRHFLAHNDAGEDCSPSLFNLDPAEGPGQLLTFEALEPVMMEVAVPENAWATTDPNAKRMKPEAEPPPGLLLERRA